MSAGGRGAALALAPDAVGFAVLTRRRAQAADRDARTRRRARVASVADLLVAAGGGKSPISDAQAAAGRGQREPHEAAREVVAPEEHPAAPALELRPEGEGGQAGVQGHRGVDEGRSVARQAADPRAVDRLEREARAAHGDQDRVDDRAERVVHGQRQIGPRPQERVDGCRHRRRTGSGRARRPAGGCARSGRRRSAGCPGSRCRRRFRRRAPRTGRWTAAGRSSRSARARRSSRARRQRAAGPGRRQARHRGRRRSGRAG